MRQRDSDAVFARRTDEVDQACMCSTYYAGGLVPLNSKGQVTVPG